MNILDRLVMELGWDTSKWDRGREEVDDDLKKTKEGAKKTSDDIEHSMGNAGKSIRKLRNQVLALFAVFTAGREIRSFLRDLVETNAETGRTAVQFDTTTESLSAWRNMSKLVGGSAEDVTSSFGSLMSSIQQFTLTGESSVIPYFRALGVNIADSGGHLKSMEQIWLDVAGALEKIPDKAKAAELAKGIGATPGMINMLLLGRSAMEKMIEEQKKLGVITEEDRKASQALQSSWNALIQSSESAGRSMLTQFSPALITVLNSLKDFAKWLLENKPVLELVFDALTAAVVGLSIALLSTLVPAFGALAGPIAAVIAAAMLLYQNWDRIGKWWGGLWEGMGEAVKIWHEGVTAILRDVHGIWDSIFGKTEPPKPSTRAGTVRTAPAQKGNRPAAPGQAPAAKPAPGVAQPTERQSSEQESDIEKLTEMGWTRPQAIGIVANLHRESTGNETSVGDKGQAYGLAQWHPDRQEKFAQWAGHDIHSSTRNEQLAFINYELRNSEKAAGAMLSKAKTATEAAVVFSKAYERPKNEIDEAMIRATIASALEKAPQQAIAASAGAYQPQAVNNNYQTSNETTIGNIAVYTQAADAEDIARELGGAIKRNTFAEQANRGMD